MAVMMAQITTCLDEMMKLLPAQVEKLKHIELAVFDVDGVLTDGKLYYSESGEQLKVFHVRDGVGTKLLRDNSIHVAVMTAKDSPMVAKRVAELGIHHYFPGVKDKRKQLESLLTELDIPCANVCYVGDDMVDVPAMELAGFSICPEDAYILVKNEVDLIAPVKGGEGVARFVCDAILEAKDKYSEAYSLTIAPHFERAR